MTGRSRLMTRRYYAAVYQHGDVQESCGHRHVSPAAVGRCHNVTFPVLRAIEGGEWRDLTDAERRDTELALDDECA